MYNYNRDVYQAEHERMERMMTAAQRQVPVHMRRDGFKQATNWLAQHVGRPAGELWSSYLSRAARRVGVYYRRTTRVVGLVLNTVEGLFEMAPRRV